MSYQICVHQIFLLFKVINVTVAKVAQLQGKETWRIEIQKKSELNFILLSTIECPMFYDKILNNHYYI